MSIIPFQSHAPVIHASAFLAPSAWVIGKVSIGADSSLFFNTVVRGDIEEISIGSGTNLQEHVLVHTSRGMSPVIIGNNVTVGHRAIIHGCTVGNGSLIGMGATILDNAVIGEECIIGAHSLIPKGMVIPPRSLVIGTPGRVSRELTTTEREELTSSAQHYRELAREYRVIFAGTS